MKPYYDDGAVTIYHGDCRDILPALANVDLVFTSPPYNLAAGTSFTSGRKQGMWKAVDRTNGITYADHDDAMPLAAYEEWQKAILRSCWNTLSPTGAIFYNHKPRFVDGHLWTPLAVNPGLPLRQIVVWDRGSGFNFVPTAYVSAHEWIIVYAREAWRLSSRGTSALSDVWRVPFEVGTEHPAPFPVGLPARAISTTPARMILDPFMGSGSTLRAAKNHGRRAIGIEVSERYCEIAAKRMGQEVLDFAA